MGIGVGVGGKCVLVVVVLDPEGGKTNVSVCDTPVIESIWLVHLLLLLQLLILMSLLLLLLLLLVLKLICFGALLAFFCAGRCAVRRSSRY